MNQAEFWKLYNNHEFDMLYPEFEKGLDFNFDIEREAKQASWGKEDFVLLHFLWEIGAKGETPFIKEIFEKFQNGESPIEMAKEAGRLEQEKKDNVAADLTAYNSVNDIPIGDVGLRLIDETEYYLNIEIEPYLFEGDVIEPFGLTYGPLSLKKDLLLNAKIEFDENTFDESIYLFHCHNPVDLKSIEFRKNNENEIVMIAEVLFNFDYENNGKDEVLVIEKVMD